MGQFPAPGGHTALSTLGAAPKPPQGLSLTRRPSLCVCAPPRPSAAPGGAGPTSRQTAKTGLGAAATLWQIHPPAPLRQIDPQQRVSSGGAGNPHKGLGFFFFGRRGVSHLADCPLCPLRREVQLTEEAVRRYLTRKPMTTKDLLKKFQTKRTGLSSDATVNVLAQILKRLNPERKVIGDKMHFSLKE